MSDYTTVNYASLRDRHVLITGGASGIGAEMVRAFCSQGAQVSFLDIDADAGGALADDTGATFMAVDLTDIDALRAAVAQVQASGAVQVLVNNAARDDRHLMGDVQPDYWRRTLALNLDHQFFATQAVVPGMARAGGGSVIMMGSVSWMRGMPGMAGYTAAKAAINGMTISLSRELGPLGVRVNCIVPGAVVTERQKALWLNPETEQQILNEQALKFRLQPEHIARMALFLGADESAGATGANFIVDAGLS